MARPVKPTNVARQATSDKTSATTFRQYADAISSVSPRTQFIRHIADITKRSEFTVRMWLWGRQTPDPLARDVIAKELNLTADELFTDNNQKP